MQSCSVGTCRVGTRCTIFFFESVCGCGKNLWRGPSRSQRGLGKVAPCLRKSKVFVSQKETDRRKARQRTRDTKPRAVSRKGRKTQGALRADRTWSDLEPNPQLSFISFIFSRYSGTNNQMTTIILINGDIPSAALPLQSRLPLVFSPSGCKV